MNYKVLRYLLFFLLLHVTCKRSVDDNRGDDNPFNNKIVRCSIALDDDMYENDGLEAGLNYELLKIFSQENNCSVETKVYTKKEKPLDSLSQKKIDILVTEKEKIEQVDSIFSTTYICNSTVWVTKNDKFEEIEYLNRWLLKYMRTEDFKNLKQRFIQQYDPIKRAESMKKYYKLSPYDNLIKKEAIRLGWDWKMLVAVLWQESRFSINSRSHRGAEGLMQVMPSTGVYYDIYDLLDPYDNIEAGTKHLNRVQRIFRKYNLSDEELVKFTLAAYNAGEGRIMDCMNLAEYLGKDKTKWSDIVEAIPHMNDEALHEEGGVRLGKFRGKETIEYVDNILKIYDALKSISID